MGNVVFLLPRNFPTGTTIYYSFDADIGWMEVGSATTFISAQFYPKGGGLPADIIPFLDDPVTISSINESLTRQNFFSVFQTRTTPTLEIQISQNEDFSSPVTLGSTLNNSIGYFHADYAQAQSDPIRWIRWQVATATYNSQTDKWILGDILQDTGDIYTPTLNYEYNGFFNGQKYAIRAIGESESGQECNSNSASEGWIYFTIAIENQGKYDGNFNVQCLNKENATLLEWEGVEVIPSTTSPQGYEPQISNGSVTLLPQNGDMEYSVTWDSAGKNAQGETIPMNFPKDWTTVWKGDLFREFINKEMMVELSGTTASAQETMSENVPISISEIRDDPSFGIYSGKKTMIFAPQIVSATNIRILSYSGAFKGEVSINNERREYTVTLYSRHPGQPAEAIVLIKYVCYKATINNNIEGEIKNYTIEEQSSNLVKKSISFTGNTIQATLYSQAAEFVAIKLNVFYMKSLVSPDGKLVYLDGANIALSRHGIGLIVTKDEIEIGRAYVASDATSMALMISPSNFCIFYYKNGIFLNSAYLPVSYDQKPISSVTIYGGESGTTVDSISVYQGDGSNVLSLYENPDFEPVWNSPDYELYMTANFNGNLEGGTGTATGSGFRIYRQEVGKNVLTPIATVPSTTTSVKDYGIVSRKAYKYSLYAYDNNGAFMSGVENEKVVATCFKNYSLLVCDYDEANDEYHVRKQYLFALNLSTGSVGNNNSPTLNANFTRYPTRMPSTQNYASGTLQGLIGAIYTVPALIEQIGNYKWTAKPSTMDYFDSVDLEQELYDLSTAPYQLFLRDMKGRLRMIATNSAITMTTNIKQKQQSISISFPWVEIGDASDVTIIQTPDDYGWNNDNQVLDVLLDVDVNTGELSATYPYPYNGTKFYLTGVNKENLTAKTPLGVTPAQFELSDIATEPDDGELNATVKVNTDNTPQIDGADPDDFDGGDFGYGNFDEAESEGN